MKRSVSCAHAMAEGQMMIETDTSCPEAELCMGRFICMRWTCEKCRENKKKKEKEVAA